MSDVWHARRIDAVTEELATDRVRGLSVDEAKSRYMAYGPNEFRSETKRSFLTQLQTHVLNPLVLILIVAFFATALLQKWIDSAVIAIAVLVNIGLGMFQEGRASRAFDVLKNSQEQFAVVVRDGRLHRIPAQTVVVGDIVQLESGTVVPADMRLISTHELRVEEAMLTGESLAQVKDSLIVDESLPITEQSNMAFMGTVVTAGVGMGVVVATGDKTHVGKLARDIHDATPPKTPFQRNIDSVAHLLLGIVTTVVVIIFALGMWRGETLTDSLLIAIAIAVAAIPEGLPAAVTIVLAIGMERLLKRGGLVRNLLAAETLGTTSVILTDKTGTLTEGHMTLSEYATADGRGGIHEAGALETLRVAVLASSGFLGSNGEEEQPSKPHGRPIEQAIILAGADAGLTQSALEKDAPLVRLIPFSSERRFGVAFRGSLQEARAYITGAPEVLLEKATTIFTNGATQLLTPELRAAVADQLEQYAKSGKRVIGVAKNDQVVHDDAILDANTFFGLLVFNDPIREHVAESLAVLQQAGTHVLMVTGDNPHTAHYVANAVGLGSAHPVVQGSDIDALDDASLYTTCMTHTIFARVLPRQKMRLVRVLQERGEVVAMTGDGVNDAPALSQASIGVAVGSGTDIAKESSDLILLENSFSVIEYAIEEGRRMRDNFKKIFAYLLSTNFSGMVIIIGALVAYLPLPVLPTQILWANMVGSGLMNIAFAFEPADPESMRRHPKSRTIRHIIGREVQGLILIVGVITGALLLVLYHFLLALDLPIEKIRTIMFVALSLDSIFFALSLKSLTRPLWQISLTSNPLLLISLGVSIVVLGAALVIPPLQILLSVTPLSFFEVGILILVAIANVCTIEGAKWLFFRRARKDTVLSHSSPV
jgi:cation-transporting P-type ATPase F